MAAPYIVPFNFQPAASGVAYDYYTPSAGRYAEVLIRSSKGSVLKNGKMIISNPDSGTLWSTGAGNLSATPSTKYTVPANVYFTLVYLNVTRNDGSAGNAVYTFKCVTSSGDTRFLITAVAPNNIVVQTANVPCFAGDELQVYCNAGFEGISQANIGFVGTSTEVSLKTRLKQGDVIGLDLASATGKNLIIDYVEFNEIS